MSDVDLGNIFYSITANDNTGGGITSAITSAAASFDFIVYAAQTMVHLVQEAYQETIGMATNLSDTIVHFSDVTGMSTDEVQRWQSACIATNTNLGDLQHSVSMVLGKIADSSTAGETYRKNLEDMGIAVTDLNGNYVDADTLQKEILEHLAAVTTASQRDTDTRIIYGRSWQAQADLIMHASQALDAYNNTPPAFTDEQIQKGYEMGIRMDEVNKKLQNIQVTIGEDLIPSTSKWVDIFDKAVNGGPIDAFFKDLNQGLSDAADGFDYLAERKTIRNQLGLDDWGWSDEAQAELDQWVQKRKMDNTLASQGYDPVAGYTYWDGTEWTKPPTTTPPPSDPGDQTEAQIELTKATTDYNTALQTEYDEQQKINDLTSNYLEDMADTGRDVAQARSLTKTYGRSMQSDTAALAKDQANVTKYGDIIIQLDGKTLGIIPEAAAGASAAGASASGSPPRTFKEWQQSLTQKGIS